jgi:hypothetical protein
MIDIQGNARVSTFCTHCGVTATSAAAFPLRFCVDDRRTVQIQTLMRKSMIEAVYELSLSTIQER